MIALSEFKEFFLYFFIILTYILSISFARASVIIQERDQGGYNVVSHTFYFSEDKEFQEPEFFGDPNDQAVEIVYSMEYELLGAQSHESNKEPSVNSEVVEPLVSETAPSPQSSGKESNRLIPDSKISGATPERKLVAKALNETIVNGNAYGELGEVVKILESVPGKYLGRYLDKLTPQMALSIKEIFLNISNTQYGQLAERLGDLRSGARGISLNGLNQEPMMEQRNAHETALFGKKVLYTVAETSPWNIFANASGVFSTITNVTDLPRLNAVTGYFSTGADYRLSQNSSVGIYGGYQGTKAWYADGFWLRANGIKFGLYGTSRWNGFYMNGIVGGGFHSIGLNRSLNFGSKNWAARSYPSAGELNSLLGGGYEAMWGKWRLGMNLSIQYTYLAISSFQETGAGNLNLRGSGQSANSLVSTLGGTLSYLWEIFPNCKIIPVLGLAWQHEYLNYGQKFIATWNSGSSFQLTSVTGARNNAFGTAGFVAQLNPRLGSYCYYNPQFGGGDIVSHGVLIGLNYTF